MTWRKLHLVDDGDIPCAYEVPAGIRIFLDRVDDLLNLIDRSAVRRLPSTPLRSINGPQIAVLVGPFVPYSDSMLFQVMNIRIAS